MYKSLKNKSLFFKAQCLLEFDKVLLLVSDYAISDEAKQIILDIIYEPFNTQLNQELSKLEDLAHFVQIVSFSLINFEPLSGDLEHMKIKGSKISVASILKIRKLIFNNQEVKSKASENLKNQYRNLFDFIELFPDLSKPDQLIKAIFDADHLIRNDATEELKRIREEQNRLNKSIYLTFKRELESHKLKNYLAEGEESVRNGRFVLRVHAEHKRKIAGNLVGESDSGKTVFIEPQVCFELNNFLTDLHLEEQREINRILTDLAYNLRPFIELFKLAYDLTLSLDVLLAKAYYANAIQGIKPNLNESKQLIIFNAYHPLLLQRFHGTEKQPVSLDLQLSETNKILLISGPNAGGKTLVLKTVGLLQLMLQKGFLIPVSKKSNFCFFNKIWVDIGDWQSLDEGLSTYSAKLVYMKKLVSEANLDSLVLMDELGSGTEPKIGGAIAEAVLNEMLELGVYGVFTTHYSNLKSFAHSQKGILNGSMRYDESKMLPLYQLQIGKPGSSFALDIARKLNFPKKLLQYAKDIAGPNLVKMEDLLAKMDEEKRNLELTVAGYKDKIDTLNRLIKAYESMQKQYELKRLKLKLNNKHIEYQQNMELKTENSNLVSEIRAKLDIIEAQKQFEERKQREIQIAKEVNQVEQEYYSLVKSTISNLPVKSGDKVMLLKQGLTGIVDEVRGNFAKVITENFTIELKTEELVHEKLSIINEPKRRVNLHLVEKLSNLPGTLDLRGQNSSQAIQALEDYFDQALLSNLKEAKILHGKGSGALKVAIHSHLKKISFINAYSHPDEKGGGNGVTLVTFK